MTLRRALLSLAACYPLSLAGFFAGIMACDHRAGAFPALLVYYLFFVFALFHCTRLASRAFAPALVLVFVHAILAFTMVVGNQADGAQREIVPLLLGIPAVHVVCGLAACRLAYRLSHLQAAWLLAGTAVGWIPVALLMGGMAFAGCFGGQAILTAYLGWAAGRRQVYADAPEIGFSRV